MIKLAFFTVKLINFCRNLAKNLIVSFLMAPPNNKMDALKIVATFLDFSEDDRVRLGMQKGQKKAGPQVNAN
jgi:hypothetical protein